MALPTFNELTGPQLEQWLETFIKSSLGLAEYFPTMGQIGLEQIDPALGNGHNLEIDGVLRINKTAVFFEITSEKNEYREKIRKFLKNVQIFTINKHLSLKEKFLLFGVSEDKIDDYEEVNSFKFVFINIQPDFELRSYSGADFADYPEIFPNLYFIKPTQLEYLRQLTNSIGPFAKNEFLSLLDFTPVDLGDADEKFSVEYIKANGKYISGSETNKADVYLIKFKINQLLKIARVSRYEGLPFSMETKEKTGNYQRLLIDEKLANISEHFIKGNKKKTFPNTITLSISEECKETADGKLTIPKKFSSIDIIDGQHRLFAYTHPEVTDVIREEAEILATAIKFRDVESGEVTKHAAKVFCEINSTQATVSQDLLYLIKYDLLGDRDLGAMAGKLILSLDKGKVLNTIFATNTLQHNSNLNKPCIHIIKIIEQELIPLLRGEGTDGLVLNTEQIKKRYELELVNDAEILKSSVKFVEWFFGYVKRTFVKDWIANSESAMITEEHFCGFARFFRFQFLNQDKTMEEIRDLIQTVRGNIFKILETDKLPCFPKEHGQIPGVHANADNVYAFLNEMSKTE
ncbi:DGQHR domain-containing protein [Pedobacter sp. MR2016-19]|uniref:DGQHR domain-containing protein n=1 Tax=Pedobacter sp. MR2016-19 TaxID=2780089 RepID=UPI0018750D56|nr:DGQHR domain-containing protein [Pedobacter sp. MR2016-19]MBE5320038.1 DGQHR domain-containing protein [Pedobacter sp. MR2016-19]